MLILNYILADLVPSLISTYHLSLSSKPLNLYQSTFSFSGCDPLLESSEAASVFPPPDIRLWLFRPTLASHVQKSPIHSMERRE